MSPRLKVLLVTETILPQLGGGETQADLLASGLAARGHGVTVVARRSIPGSPPEEQARYRVLRVGPDGGGRWRKWGLLVTLPPVLRGLVLEQDVIVVSGFRLLGLPVIKAARAANKPVVLKADSPGEWSGEYFSPGLAAWRLTRETLPIRRWLASRNRRLSQAAAFVAMGESLRHELLSGGVAADRVSVIPNGVDTHRFAKVNPETRQHLRSRLGLPAGPVLIFCGRLVRYKGLESLLAAWNDTSRMHPSATLVLVGEGGHDMDACGTQLRAYVTNQGLHERVRFVGAVQDPVPWLQASDIFVFPTEREAFGLALVEAMACGLPSITTTVGALQDFVEDGRNAIVVTPGDTAGLKTAMARLLSDLQLADTIGQAAREVAVDRFSAERVVTDWESLLMSVVRRQRP